jgi:3-hydroxyacyl-[acyl-carrier-protein] dehydratase
MRTTKLIIDKLTPAEILSYVPQQAPFRFIEQITYVDDQEIRGTYTFKNTEFFYAGHFPEKAITPGVILLECMSQIGVVAFGIYLLSGSAPVQEIKNRLTVFTDAQVEFFKSVYPGDQVEVIAKKIFWRKMKLKSQIVMYDSQHNVLAAATASGMGILL